MKKLLPLLLAVTLLFSACAKAPAASVKTEDFNTNYKFVFVHGLSGWGSYDTANRFLKYWGMFGGDLIKYLNSEGFDCYSASVAPQGSAWDRACELYAQLTGSVVDYGKEHSERCNHARYGEDFSKKPLIDKWDSENKINLLGHSFGGATVRMLSELMANGSEAELVFTLSGEAKNTYTVDGSGNKTPLYTVEYAIDGDIPEGMTFDPETGTLSGVPTQNGRYKITVSVLIDGWVSPDLVNDDNASINRFLRWTYLLEVNDNGVPGEGMDEDLEENVYTEASSGEMGGSGEMSGEASGEASAG